MSVREFALSFRIVRALASYVFLSQCGATVEYPIFLNTRDVDIGNDVALKQRCWLGGSIRLDDSVSVGPNCTLYGSIDIGHRTRLNGSNDIRGTVKVGRYCAIARSVTFQEPNHDFGRAAVQHRLFREVLGMDQDRVARDQSQSAVMSGSGVAQPYYRALRSVTER